MLFDHSDGDHVLVVSSWHTECRDCRYGRGGWAASPAREGKPILTPESRTCHGCGVTFTHVEDVYGGTLTALPAESDAA